MFPGIVAAEFKGLAQGSPVGIRLLAVSLVGVLFVCHGVFGAFHLFPGTQISAIEVGAGQQDAAEAHEGSGAHPADESYFAVLPMVLLLGVALALLLRIERPWLGNARPAFTVVWPRPPVTGFMREGSRHIVLQVFRL